MEPTELWGTDTPSREQISEFIESRVDGGALGVKLVGGHWPLSAQACRDTIELCNEKDAYVAWHAGTTTAHSDILGMKQAVEVTGDMRLHLAHINSYCRGRVHAPDAEANEAIELLKSHPRIWSEAYLSPLNGTHLSCDKDGNVLDFVTRTCLEIYKRLACYALIAWSEAVLLYLAIHPEFSAVRSIRTTSRVMGMPSRISESVTLSPGSVSKSDAK